MSSEVVLSSDQCPFGGNHFSPAARSACEVCNPQQVGVLPSQPRVAPTSSNWCQCGEYLKSTEHVCRAVGGVVPTSKDDNELIQRVCRGVASIQEGERLRAYIAGLQSALERSQHQITMLLGARAPVETTEEPDIEMQEYRAACRTAIVYLETDPPMVQAAIERLKEPDGASEKASDELPSQAAVIHDNGDAYK